MCGHIKSYIALRVWSTSLPGNPMPDEKPTPEPEGPPAPATPEKPGRPSKKKEEAKEEPKAPRAPKKLEGVKEDFRYIVRMANTDLDGSRSAGYALTASPGVGIRLSEAVADLAGVPRAERLGNLSEEQTDKIEATLSNLGELFPPWMVNRPKDWESGLDLHLVGAEVEVRLRDDINLMKMIRSYKGVRHETGQKVRGQRTRSNGRTGLTVGVTKKAALEAAKAEKEREQLLRRLGRLGLLPLEGTTLDDVLALDVEAILSRRLQTLTFLKGLAFTPRQARQFIVHGHVSIAGRRVTIPGILVSRTEENGITYDERSVISSDLHPVRPSGQIPTPPDRVPRPRSARCRGPACGSVASKRSRPCRTMGRRRKAVAGGGGSR